MRKIACFVLLVTILSGCEKAYVQSEVIPDKVSFSTDIVPIFSTSCTSCHSNGGQFSLLILTSDVAYNQLLSDGWNAPYVNIEDPPSSSLYVKMNSNMPPEGLLSFNKIEMILKWIEEGAENN
jgi:hypothetical protein